MASARFRPAVALAPSDIRALLFDTRIMRRLGAAARANAQASNDAANAIDGDPNTYWLVGDARNRALKHPHELTVTFPTTVAMSGLVLMPRQNHREHEGDIREYVLHASDDGAAWREISRGQLVSTFAPQQLRFPATVNARHLRLTALNGFGPDTTAALAELAVVYAGPRLAEDTDVTGVEYRRGRTATTDIDAGTDAADRPAPPPARTTRRPAPRRRRTRARP
jgi:beta-galactosidase